MTDGRIRPKRWAILAALTLSTLAGLLLCAYATRGSIDAASGASTKAAAR